MPTTYNPAVLLHGNGRTYTTYLVIGTPVGQTVNYIVEIHPTKIDGTLSNPILNLPIPDDQNSNANAAVLLNLRRITDKFHVEGWLYDTQAVYGSGGAEQEPHIVYDHCYIEANRGDVFNGTTGAITVPTTPLTDASNIKSALKKAWMLKQLARSGAYTTGGVKEALTFQYRGISDPAGTNEYKNEYHKKTFITGLTFSDDSTSKDTFIVSGKQCVRQLHVSFDVIWGDPNA